jgi:hypothetical protein
VLAVFTASMSVFFAPDGAPFTGLLLADVLEQTGGAYAWDFPAPPPLRERWAFDAERLSDPVLARIARQETVRVPFEHLRGLDPSVTRVTVRFTVTAVDGDPNVRFSWDV